MLSSKLFARGLYLLALSISLPAFAAQSPQHATDAGSATDAANAACKQARKDLAFMQQLAMTDGGTNPYLDLPAPKTCKSTEPTNDKDALSTRKAVDAAPAAANRGY